MSVFRRSPIVLFRPLALLVLASASRAGNVLVVDGAGGAGFTEIQPAVEAASEGDTILVKSGTYASFAVVNKSLSVVGDTGQVVRVDGVVRVHGLASGKTVVIASLHAFGIPGTGQAHGVYVANDAGSVRLEDCEFTGASGDLAIRRDGWDAARVDGCADVCLIRCTLLGGMGLDGDVFSPPPYFPGLAGVGLRAVASQVSLYECHVYGGSGRNGCNGGGLDGGSGNHACLAEDSSILAMSCTLIGGSGGDAGSCACVGSYGGGAGNGTHLGGSGSTASMRQNTEAGGWTGDDLGGFCIQFPGFQVGARYGSVFTDFAPPARELLADLVAREGTPIHVTLSGSSQDLSVTLFLSEGAQALPIPPWEGILQLRRPLRGRVFGTFHGFAQTQFTVLDLGPGVESRTYHLQPLYFNISGVHILGEPRSVIVVDSAF